MKKIITLLCVSTLLFTFTACNQTDNSMPTEETTISIENTTAAEEIHCFISIPYSCFETGIPSDTDLVITGKERSNGITDKKKLDNGGMIITIDKTKYNDLLKYQEEKIADLFDEQLNATNILSKIEHNDDFSTISIYQMIEDKPTYANNNNGLPVAQIQDQTPTFVSYENNIVRESIYYQALLKMTDTESLTCTVKYINNSTTEVLSERIYPQE